MSSDNLFDRLADLFRSSGPVNWRLAREIAESLAGEREPVEPWLAEEYADLVHTAAMRIDAVSPLDPTAAVAEIHPVDRRTWAGENVESLAYLAEPLADRMSTGSALGGLMGQLAPALIGMQMGSVIGLASQQALGTFDVGLPAQAASPIALIVPNVESFATEHGIDARQTRLWVAMYEVTHHAAFAVPWVREHFLMLVHHFVDGLEFDPGDLIGRLGELQDPSALQDLVDQGDLTGLMASPSDSGALDEIRAFMTLMEGYADHLIGRAAAGLLPEARALRSALDAAREGPSEGEQVLQQMIGLDLSHGRSGEGATFCTEVERRWGEESLARIWEGPEMLPTAAELDDPVGWAARTLL